MIPETGILGFLSLVFLALFHMGAVAAAWVRSRSEQWEERFLAVDEAGSVIAGEASSPKRLGVFIIAAAWGVATAGLAVSFYTVALWWLWWWLLAAGVFGLALFSADLIRERTVLLAVSPQYSLALSFAMILLLSIVVFCGTYATRFYLAEVSYTNAVRVGNINDQERHINRALAYRSASVEYRLALASLYFERAKLEADKGASASPEAVAEQLAAAVGEARRAADADPHNVETWETLSLMYLNARALAADANEWARDATNRALALEPTNPVLSWRLGAVEEFASNSDEAEKLYKRAIELKPDYVAAYVSLSQLYEAQNALDAAILAYEPIASVVENDAELLFNLGRLFYNRNGAEDMDRAEAILLHAVELQPQYSNALYSLGLVYERRGDRANARKYYERVRALNPDNPDILKKLRQL
jgi:tetratricopeptide (TPR) repeat protein